LIGYDGHKRINGTKIHAVVTARSLPVAVMIGSAREHEGRKLIALMESVGMTTGKGRPRKRPRTLYADTKYDMPLNRFYLAKKGILSQIKDLPCKKKRPGRPRLFDAKTYGRVRSSVERFNAWIKSFRRVATRYETTDILHGLRTPGVYHHLSSNIAMSSKKEKVIY
jgi:transposase